MFVIYSFCLLVCFSTIFFCLCVCVIFAQLSNQSRILMIWNFTAFSLFTWVVYIIFVFNWHLTTHFGLMTADALPSLILAKYSVIVNKTDNDDGVIIFPFCVMPRRVPVGCTCSCEATAESPLLIWVIDFFFFFFILFASLIIGEISFTFQFQIWPEVCKFIFSLGWRNLQFCGVLQINVICLTGF